MVVKNVDDDVFLSFQIIHSIQKKRKRLQASSTSFQSSSSTLHDRVNSSSRVDSIPVVRRRSIAQLRASLPDEIPSKPRRNNLIPPESINPRLVVQDSEFLCKKEISEKTKLLLNRRTEDNWLVSVLLCRCMVCDPLHSPKCLIIRLTPALKIENM